MDTYAGGEVFVIGTFGVKTPVGEIYDKTIGNHDTASSMTKRLKTLYRELVEQNTRGSV